MLKQRAARALHYDPATDEARIEVSDVHAPPKGGPRPTLGQLLLDSEGFLVGVDLGGEGLLRTVVMLGPHEKVARTSPAKVLVVSDASDGPIEVRVKGAKGALRGGEKNPYL
jgi:hypothetical protein